MRVLNKFRRHRRGGTLAAAALLAGCLGPRPQPPAAAALIVPADWRTEAASTVRLEANWWRGFGDPALTALVEKTLVTNADLGVAAARVQEARAQFRFARAQQMPLATLAAFTGQSRILVLAEGVDGYGLSPQGVISYDLDIFGKRASATASSRASLLASAETRDSIALALASTAASGYIELVGFDAQLATAQATLAARAEALRVARRRASAGYTSELELKQAESEYQATAQIIPAAQLAITRQEDALSTLAGDPPRAIIRGGSLDGMQAPLIPEGLPSSLLERRPDLAAARANLFAGEKSLDSARAAELPDFSLTGTLGAAISTSLPGVTGLYALGASLLTPLFDGGRLRSRADAAAAQRNQAAFAYRKVALTAFQEVEDGLASVKHLGEQQATIDAQVGILRETLRLATNRYRDGYAPYLDQIDAERSLLAAQLISIQLQAARLSAIVTLYQAMGGGWRQPTQDQAGLTPKGTPPQ